MGTGGKLGGPRWGPWLVEPEGVSCVGPSDCQGSSVQCALEETSPKVIRVFPGFLPGPYCLFPTFGTAIREGV